MNDEYKLTGTYYPPGEMEKHEGKIPPIHSIESTSEALPVGWVSVEDRLPEQETLVLAHQNLNGICLRMVIGDSEWYDENNNYDDSELDITHWMPLPAPPKE